MIVGCGLFDSKHDPSIEPISAQADDESGADRGIGVITQQAYEPTESTEIKPVYVNDGLRMPDMLGLPTERDLRKVPADEKPAGGVSARPPVDPARPKEP